MLIIQSAIINASAEETADKPDVSVAVLNETDEIKIKTEDTTKSVSELAKTISQTAVANHKQPIPTISNNIVEPAHEPEVSADCFALSNEACEFELYVESIITTHGSDYTYGNWSVNTATTLTNGAALYKSFNHLVQPDNTVYSSSGSALKKSYTYKEVNGKNYGLVSSLTYQNGTYSGSTFTAGNTSNTYSYTYDSFGNITAVYLNNTLREQYAYDDLGELVRADSLDTGYTLVIEYDNLGNITKMKKTACTFGDLTNCQFTEYNYTYGNTSWTDLLTNYNGNNIYYDEIGNPTTYYTGADLTWIGRRLRKYTLGDLTNTYTYNGDGIRVRKVSADSNTNTTVTTEYVLDGSNIIAIVEDGTVKTRFYYDADGTRIAMDYLGSTYYYQYNLQGDVIALLDSTFTPVVTYTYGPWGTVEDITDSTNINLSDVNPFLYRGYYYDADTELYYLQSRYYDPTTGRFINADRVIDQRHVLGTNLCAYCTNNPINVTDETGNLPFFALTAAIGAAVGAVVGGIVAAQNGGNVWAGIGIGAAAGALIGTGVGMAAGAALAGSITATTGAVMAGGSALISTVASGGIGAGLTYIANNLQQAGNAISNAVATTVRKITVKAPSNIGKSFEVGKTGLQTGVDPNTLIPKKDLSTLNLHRMADAIKYAGDQAVRVGKTGIILDGHHRVADAIMNGRAIDVFVEPFK